MKRLLVVGTFLFILLLAACVAGSPAAISSLPTKTPWPTITPIPTVVEPGLAYGEPCKPPCWRGLTPGQSSHDDVSKALEQLKASGWADEIVGDADGFLAYPSSGNAGVVGVLVISGTVAKIHGDVLFDYTFGDVVEKFGNPEGVYSFIKGGAGEYSCPNQKGDYQLGVNQGDAPVYLLYPSQGLTFLAIKPTVVRGLFCPGMRIVAFVYHAPLSMSVALNNHYLADLFSNPALEDITEQDLIQWHGFGGGY